VLSPEEEAQFWEVHLKTSEWLFRKAYRMCRGHEADAQDALQRTYLKALAHWATVSELSDQRRQGWMTTTLTREVLQIWGEPHRRRETDLNENAGERPGSTRDIDAVDDKLRFHRVCRVIATSLEGRQREVMALHCLAGYEIAEVAEILEVSASTVRVHLHDARLRLRAIMAGEEDTGHDLV
jgi:RNA polymerase sigma-70 factor, ECF subfamily